MCCHLRLNNKQPVNILNQYWIHLLLKDHYFKCIFIPTHFMTSPSSKNIQMSWFSLHVLKFLLCFILKFQQCFTSRNFECAALFFSEVSKSCIFLPIVLLSVLLYVYLLHLSVHSCIFACCTFQCLYLLVCFWILTVILLSVLSCFLTCVQKQGLHPPGEDCHSLWFSCVRQPCLDSLGFLLHCFLHKQHS